MHLCHSLGTCCNVLVVTAAAFNIDVTAVVLVVAAFVVIVVKEDRG